MEIINICCPAGAANFVITTDKSSSLHVNSADTFGLNRSAERPSDPIADQLETNSIDNPTSSSSYWSYCDGLSKNDLTAQKKVLYGDDVSISYHNTISCADLNQAEKYNTHY